MDFSQKIKKWIRNLFDQDRLDLSYHPWKNWRTMILIFLLGEMIIFSSHYLFYQWAAPDLDQVSSEEGANSISRLKNNLDRISSRYKIRQAELETAKQNPRYPVDPNL